MDLYGCSAHLGGGDHVPVCAGPPRSYVDVVLAVMARANAHGPVTLQQTVRDQLAKPHPSKICFCNYAFDMWMARTCPHFPFERYADDAICHCKAPRRRTRNERACRPFCGLQAAREDEDRLLQGYEARLRMTRIPKGADLVLDKVAGGAWLLDWQRDRPGEQHRDRNAGTLRLIAIK
jgi:hypothetical protein